MIFIFNSDVEYITICSSRKYPYPSPPPMEGNRNSEGRGLQKVEISEGMGVGACFLRSFLRELRVTLLNYQNLTAALLSKLSVILLLMIF